MRSSEEIRAELVEEATVPGFYGYAVDGTPYTGPRCEHCDEDPEAPCQGSPSCHGYWNGCSCIDCRASDRRDHEEHVEEVNPR